MACCSCLNRLAGVLDMLNEFVDILDAFVLQRCLVVADLTGCHPHAGVMLVPAAVLQSFGGDYLLCSTDR